MRNAAVTHGRDHVRHRERERFDRHVIDSDSQQSARRDGSREARIDDRALWRDAFDRPEQTGIHRQVLAAEKLVEHTLDERADNEERRTVQRVLRLRCRPVKSSVTSSPSAMMVSTMGSRMP